MTGLPSPAASSGSSQSGAPSTGAGKGSSPAAGGGEGIDYQEAFKSTRGELEKTKGQLLSMGRDFEGFKKQTTEKTSVLDKLQKVLSGEDEKGSGKDDPVQQWEQQLDYYLEQAVQAEKEGRPMPLTTNLAVQHFQDKIANYREKQELTGKLSKMEQALQALSNPTRQLDHNAYSSLDNNIIQNLDSLYGQPGVVTPQKEAQFKAISAQLSSTIREIQEQAPQNWDRIRRDPAMQKRLVEAVVKQNLPPAVVRQMEQEHLQNTPMSTNELWEAFREAAQIEDPKQRQGVREKIRQQLVERMYTQHQEKSRRGR